MNIYIYSIFPEIFESFLNTSLIKKAQESDKIKIQIVDIRDFSKNKHRQIDDKIYGWGAWMLIQAQPVIDAIENTIQTQNLKEFDIIFLSPSDKILDQEICFEYSKKKNIILLAWRYEWIDYRVQQYFQDKYAKFEKISIGKYILMWWEIPAMVFMESVIRLLPGVISKSESYIDESYSPTKNMKNLEEPKYTMPKDIYGYKVPDILLSGHDANIQKRKEDNQSTI